MVDPSDRPGALQRRELLALFLVAVLVRLAFVVLLDSPRMAASGDPWTWGQETACVAESILSGGPYGDPWNQDTGASGWLTPAFPAFLAACAKLTGGIGRPAAWLLYSTQALLGAGMCLGLIALGRRLGRPRAGRYAGWLLAFLPAALWNASHTVWDTHWSAAALLGFLTLAVNPKVRPLPEGLAFGAMGLVSASLWATLPAVLWHLIRREKGPAVPLRLIGFGLGAFLVAGPWMIRNARVIGTFNLRTNLGVELRVGNNDEAYGRHNTDYHPSHTPTELARYREMGEKAYVAEVGREAIQWMRDNPGPFARLIGIRLSYFWLGSDPASDQRMARERQSFSDMLRGRIKWISHAVVGVLGLVGALLLRGRGSADTLLRWSVFLFPLPYYVTHVAERYRFPIEPLLLFLMVALATRESRCPLGTDHSQP